MARRRNRRLSELRRLGAYRVGQVPRSNIQRSSDYVVVCCPRYVADRGDQRVVLRRRNHQCEGCSWLWILVSGPNLGWHLRQPDVDGKCSFWSYEWMRQAWSSPDDTDRDTAMKVLLCGGLAGVVTWASIFPLDVIKTRVQTQALQTEIVRGDEGNALLQPTSRSERLSSFEIARQAYRAEGAHVFFRGLGVCSARAFIVNAVQWAMYEWVMKMLQQK